MMDVIQRRKLLEVFMSKLGKQLQDKKEELIQIRRDFHRHPELSLQEFRTAQVIE